MYDLLSDELSPWFGSAVVLTVGSALIVAAAVLICRLLKSPTSQRTAWQIGVLGLLALLAVELTGMGTALARLGQMKMSEEAPSVGVVEPEKAERPAGESDQEVSVPATTFAYDVGVVERFSDDTAEEESAARMSHEIARAGKVRIDREASVEDGSLILRADRGAISDYTAAIPRTLLDQEPSEPVTVASVGVTGRNRLPWPVAIWAGVGLLLLARVVWIRFRLLWFRRRCEMMTDKQLGDRTDRLARRLGLRRPVHVLRAAGLATPVACGLVRPTILLPTGFEERFDGSRQDVILAHELAHLAGRDPAWQLLAEMLCALLWWNPLTYLVRSGLRTASEVAADDASLLVPNGPDLLAGCLVSLGRQLTQTRKFAWLSMGGSGFRSCLGKRVERLLSLSARSWRPPRRRLSAVAKIGGAVLLVFATVFSTVWARSQTSLEEGESTMNVLTTSWRRSMAATVVMACLVPLSGGEATAGGLFAEEAEHHEREGAERRERAERERAERREHEEREHKERERGERGRHERDEDGRPLVRERAELIERAESIERELRELGDRRPEESRGLRRELEEIQERIGHIERELGEGHHDRERHDIFRELIELKGREFELDVALEVLPEGHEEEARDIKRELREIMERIQQIEREHREPPPEIVRELMHHRLDQLRHAMERLREAGKPEQAERLEGEVRELAEKIDREPHERRGPRHPEAEEGPARHVMEALENLHAAGLHELAEKLAREIEGRHGERPPEPPRHREGPPHPGELGPGEELRGQVHEMRREMDELRELLKEVLDRERR